MKTQFLKYKEMVEIEVRLQKQIAKKTICGKENLVQKIREIMCILNVPKLYHQYINQVTQIKKLLKKKNEKLKEFIAEQGF